MFQIYTYYVYNNYIEHGHERLHQKPKISEYVTCNLLKTSGRDNTENMDKFEK